MTTTSYTDFRTHLAQFFDKAEQDCEEIVVSRGKGRKVIVLSLNDYLSLQETAYLLSSKRNRTHLEKSLNQARKGRTSPAPF